MWMQSLDWAYFRASAKVQIHWVQDKQWESWGIRYVKPANRWNKFILCESNCIVFPHGATSTCVMWTYHTPELYQQAFDEKKHKSFTDMATTCTAWSWKWCLQKHVQIFCRFHHQWKLIEFKADSVFLTGAEQQQRRGAPDFVLN